MKRNANCTAAAFAALATVLIAAVVTAEETVAPRGDYQIARLMLEKAWDKGEPIPLLLGLRDGRATSVWFCAREPHGENKRIWADEVTVKLDSGTLQGDIKGRRVTIWGGFNSFDYAYSLDAKVSDGKVTGTWTGKWKDKTVSGDVTGAIASAQQLRQDQAFASGKDWPWYYGAGGALRGPDCGVTFVDNLQDARPVWKSEDAMPTGWGNGPDGRYKDRVCVTGPTGGASSPVVAGGLVYQFYYWPSGALKDEAQLKEAAAKLSPSVVAQRWYLDWHRPLADDIIVCLDAATGKTVWKTTFKENSINHQTHKWRGFNPTPFVADGIVYVVNYSQRLYALDAKTGKLLWQYDKAAAKTFTASAAGPVVADGVVVMAAGDLIGLDAKSGAEKWKLANVGGHMLPWRKDGKGYFIVRKTDYRQDKDGKKSAVAVIHCLEAATGKLAWKADAEFRAMDIFPIIEGDYLVGYDALVENNVVNSGQVLCYRLKTDGMEKAWSSSAPAPATDSFGVTIANGCVYVDGEKSVACLKLDNGQLVAKVDGPGGARTQLAFAADGRVFIQPEGRHGGQSFFMLDADPKHFRALLTDAPADGNHRLPGQWFPPSPTTSAYANMPISYPLVDGRLFVRGFDGIYCYDLRKQK